MRAPQKLAFPYIEKTRDPGNRSLPIILRVPPKTGTLKLKGIIFVHSQKQKFSADRIAVSLFADRVTAMVSSSVFQFYIYNIYAVNMYLNHE